MPTADDIDFMKAYAVRGISDWRHAGEQVRTRAIRLLGNRLAQREEEAKATIESIVSGMKGTRFIPMPNRRPDDIEYCFFMPITYDAGTAFDLLILCSDNNCLGFRFEPADPRLTTHGYGHIQMNRRMEGGTLAVGGLPEWVPTSYPAFPLRTSEPIKIFLSMVTAIHGYPKFMDDVLQKTIPAAGNRQVYARMLEAAMV